MDIQNKADPPKWKTRLLKGEFPGRDFDIEFWPEQGDAAIFDAAWEMIEFAEEVKHGRKPTFQYTEPRYTKDLDIWVASSMENSARVFRALARVGAPLAHDGVTP